MADQPSGGTCCCRPSTPPRVLTAVLVVIAVADLIVLSQVISWPWVASAAAEGLDRSLPWVLGA